MALVAVALLPSAVVDFYYSLQVTRLTRSAAIQFSTEKVQGAADEIRLLLEKTQAAEYSVLGNMVLSPLFVRPLTLGVVTKYGLSQRFTSDLRSLMLTFPFISGIYVYSWDGSEYSTASTGDVGYAQIKSQPWFAAALHTPHRLFITPTDAADNGNFSVPGEEVLSYIQAVTASRHPWQLTVVRIDIDVSVIAQLLGTALVEDRGAASLVGDGNATLAVAGASAKDWVGTKVKPFPYEAAAARAQGAMLIQRSLTGYHLDVIARLPAGSFRQALESVRRGSLLIVLLDAIFALVVALLLSSRITRPLDRLVAAMREVERGNLKVQTPAPLNSDLRLLTTTFNTMLGRIDSAMRQNMEKERARSLAVFKALEAKINSHFLYNTLDVMRGIAFAHRDYAVVEMAEAMANIFRYSANQECEVVPLRDEVRHIRDYARIQKHRYGHQITFRCSIPKHLLDVSVLKLSLQPLVENAFNHAFTSRPRAGKILVSADSSHDDLVLEIRDNGVGICPEHVESINRELTSGGEELSVSALTERGVGIRNVNRRIHHFFGSGYGLSIESRPGSGTTVIVRLPLRGESPCFTQS